MKSETFIILLRGINVSGQKLIRMEPLRQAFADAGFENVKTYIQSGNIIADLADDAQAVEQKAVKIIADRFGFDVGVLVLTVDEIAYALRSLPFEGAGNKVYFAFLSAKPTASARAAWQKVDWAPDKTSILNRVMYLHYGESAGKSKLTNNLIEKKLGVTATMRNLNTVVKLHEMSAGPR